MVTGASEPQQIRTGSKIPQSPISFETTLQAATSISKYSFFLLHRNDTLVIQYLRCRASLAWPHGSAGSTRAVPSNSSPVILPRIVQGATLTRELLRMRLYLPESFRVITQSFPLCSANHIGVYTAAPFLRNVANERYF